MKAKIKISPTCRKGDGGAVGRVYNEKLIFLPRGSK